MENLLNLKRGRDNIAEGDLDLYFPIKSASKKEDNNNIHGNIIYKQYKTMKEIKIETIEKYKALNDNQKQDNKYLLELISDCDIIEEININILNNDINYINLSKQKNEEIKKLIVHYNKLRYTISTSKRKIILEQIKKIKSKEINEINFDYEYKDPKNLLQSFLLNILELYYNILTEMKLNKKYIKPFQFRNDFSLLLNNEGYDIGQTFLFPGNFGNTNFKFSLLFRDFLKIYDMIIYKKDTIQNTDAIIKSLFEKKTKILNIFSKTIENKKNLLKEELYYKYLKIIYIILVMFDKKQFKKSNELITKSINNCMIKLISKKKLKKFIKKNPESLYIKINGLEVKLTNEIIDKMTLKEILIYKEKKENFEFDIKKYNSLIFEDFKVNIRTKDWIYCNFEYIEEFNFININEELKTEFKNNLYNIIRSPYMKKVYFEVETRFEKNYIFDDKDNKIFNEIYDFISFFPFPSETDFGYSNRTTFDIYINMYIKDNNSFSLLGKMLANTNDALREIYHMTPYYYILNSEEKNMNNLGTKLSKEKKLKCVNIQKEFIKNSQSKNQRIKKEDNIDFGDAIEIICYGFCIKIFSFKNVCELFLEKNWYDEEIFKNFKINYIKRDYIENNDEEDEIEEEEEIDDDDEEGKKEFKENEKNIQKKEIEENEKNNDGQKIDIKIYREKSKIINIFLKYFPIKNINKNIKINYYLLEKENLMII